MTKPSRQQLNTIRTRFDMSTLFNLVTILVSVAAIGLSWNANKIAEAQNKSNIIVLSDKNLGFDFDGATAPVVHLACVERIRLANLGGVPDSIVDYDTVVHYQNSESVFTGDETSLAEFRLFRPTTSRISFLASEELRSAMTKLEVSLFPSENFGNGSAIKHQLGSIEFPYAVAEHSAFDLGLSIMYAVANGNDFNLYYEPGQSVFSSEPSNLPQLEFEIRIKLASGGVVTTPRIPCGAIGRIPGVKSTFDSTVQDSGSSIFNMVFDPPAESYVKNGEKVLITFDYVTSEVGGVRIFAFPSFADGVLPLEIETNPSPVFPPGQGKGEAFVTVTSGAGVIDSIWMSMVSATEEGKTLYESRVPAVYEFRD